jgi:23S rRNA (guanosine2251-2'-O)-methyltransferase
VEWFPVYAATNLKRFLDNRKEEGFWVVGMDGSAQSDLRDLQADRPLMLVLGNEGKGVRPLVLSACDWTVKISGTNQVESLNVSSAAALALYQVSSQAL